MSIGSSPTSMTKSRRTSLRLPVFPSRQRPTHARDRHRPPDDQLLRQPEDPKARCDQHRIACRILSDPLGVVAAIDLKYERRIGDMATSPPQSCAEPGGSQPACSLATLFV